MCYRHFCIQWDRRQSYVTCDKTYVYYGSWAVIENRGIGVSVNQVIQPSEGLITSWLFNTHLYSDGRPWKAANLCFITWNHMTY